MPKTHVQSCRRYPVAVAALVLVCGTVGSALAQAPVHFGKEGTVKVRVPSGEVPQSLMTPGTLVSTYESFVVVEVPAAEAPLVGEVLSNENRILLNSGALDTSTPEVKALQKPRGQFEGKAMQIVQFAGPIQPEWYNALALTGVEIVTCLPSNSYLVYGDSAQITRLETLAAVDNHIQFTAEFRPEHKIHRAAARIAADPKRAEDKTQFFAIQMVLDPVANARTIAAIDAVRTGEAIRSDSALNYYNIMVPLPPRALAAIAAQPDVVSIQVYEMPRLMWDERQDQIVAGNLTGNVPSGTGYLAWLGTRGFTQAQFNAGTPFGVDVTDSGIDNGTTTPFHFGLFVTGIMPGTSRILYNRIVGTPGGQIKGCDGHGTVNAHIVMGYNNNAVGFPHTDATGYHYGLGVCPFTRAGSSVIFSPNYTSPDFEDLQSMAYNNNARISTNSWGANVGGAYNADSQRYDALVRDAQPTGSTFPVAGNQQMVIVFSAGNAGSGGNTIGSPGTGKNVFCIGAGENVHQFGGADGCGDGDNESNSANDIINFSSRGPCDDGRQKPDIVAPGVHITGGVIQANATPGVNGTADACYNGSLVCGGVGNIFYPAGQQFYTSSSGTSHSCPAVAGGAALVRQFFVNQGMSVPSPAMTKAFLMNSARYMNGVGAGGNLWSTSQGMGGMNLGEAFNRVAVTPTFLRDQIGADMFTASGQVRSWGGVIADPTKPTRVTLAWTEPPGPTAGSAFINNLDLTVTVGANTYKGNVFTGANSTTGGAADGANNVESVFIPAGASGPITIVVNAVNIAGDGVPNVGGALDQDFALVAYNANNVVAAATGSCCLSASSCIITTASGCTGSGGVYRGDNSACPTITANGSPQTFTSTNVPVAISSVGAVTVTSTLNVVPAFPIFKATVNLTIAHTYDSDLVLTLIAPGGQSVVLAANVGLSNDNFTNTTFDDAAATSITAGAAPFTGTFRPAPGSLASLQGVASNGTWTLRIEDQFNLDGGSLNAWSLTLTPGQLPTCVGACYANCDNSTVVPILNANDFSCFLNAFAAGQSYANCDNSTVVPILNANDFSCFLNAFAAGCS